MLTCLVLWCESKGKIPGVHYFCLTRARHDIWMRALGRDPTVEHSSEKNVICSKHFSPEDLYTKGQRMFLKLNAVPRFFLRRNDQISALQDRTLREMQSFENLLQHPPQPQQIGVEIDNVEVLFVDNKGNSSGGVHVSCTPTVEIGEGSPWSITTSSMDSPRSFKRSHGDTSTDSKGNRGQMKRARREIKIRHNYSASPSNLLRKLKHANVRTTLAQKKVKVMKVKVDRLKKKVTSLKQILLASKREELVSENGLKFLEKSITGVPLSLMKRTIEVRKRKLQGKKLRDKFSDDLRTFAMTLQFLSSKAYSYVRRVFDLALPAPSTIRKWLSKVNCEPGFCENSFSSLKMKILRNKNTHYAV
ncbi:hypothetical protein JTB14_004915 [Gonioctena quinquepunctata]|nr:hypothetical protein JTB14_004915 [Gonioctena quinquepunctata]